jgi:aryl-alcohol dehydrogenase-like predicted oxidoreductase
MEYRKLGKSNMRASVIGLGALHFGVFLNKKETIHIVHHAIEEGINFIDTSPLYGNRMSESYLGEALKGLRSKVILSTKAGLRPAIRKDGSFGVEIAKLTNKYLRKSIEKSLILLGTDYIDLFQLHAFDWETPFQDTIVTLETLVKEGKIRAVGCSNYTRLETLEALSYIDGMKEFSLTTLQCHFNLIERRAEKELIPICRKNQIGVICNRSLARGILTGKYRPQMPLPPASRAETSWRIRKWLSQKTLEMVDQLDAYAKSNGRSSTELSISWLLMVPEVKVVLVGVRNTEQLDKCIKACEWILNKDMLFEIESLICSFLPEEQIYSMPEVILEK